MNDLDRFIEAQSVNYDDALSELKAGLKRTHWMWYVFPQLAGLGTSAMAWRYGIRDLAEARAYLEHPVLGSRLTECFEVLLGLEGRSAHDVFGSPDDMKLKSCATLFEIASGGDSVFSRALEKYYSGDRDSRTVAMLTKKPE